MHVPMTKKRRITTTISHELYREADLKRIKLSYALSIGIRVILGRNIASHKVAEKEAEELMRENNTLREHCVRLERILKGETRRIQEAEDKLLQKVGRLELNNYAREI